VHRPEEAAAGTPPAAADCQGEEEAVGIPLAAAGRQGEAAVADTQQPAAAVVAPGPKTAGWRKPPAGTRLLRQGQRA